MKAILEANNLGLETKSRMLSKIKNDNQCQFSTHFQLNSNIYNIRQCVFDI